VVPAATAARIRERDVTRVVAQQSVAAPATATPASDDPYKDFPVPDDLIW
jgi:uncharacterized protein YaiL (DUF2058 family)